MRLANPFKDIQELIQGKNPKRSGMVKVPMKQWNPRIQDFVINEVWVKENSVNPIGSPLNLFRSKRF